MSGEKSTPKGFSKGLISDVDPRYQIEGSYRDAMNIKLVSSEGSTFTIENINGNKKVVDLHEIDKTFPASYLGDGTQTSSVPLSYFASTGSEPYVSTSTGKESMNGAANIVGHYSFRNQLFIIVCGYIFYGNSNGSQEQGDFRTAFFLLDFDSEGEIKKCIDLRAAYNPVSGVNQYPNLNMDPLIKCRVEGVIENDSISRVYWTDNKNPLRTLSLYDEDMHTMDPGELDVNPKCEHNQISLNKTISGSLPVGVYQYCYKYISDAGAESGISPLSNIYHISNASSNNYKTYYGGDPGVLSNDGFTLTIDNLDVRFDSVKIYALYYERLNTPPQVAEVITKDINPNGSVEFQHTSLTRVIENGIENILIPTNTWDICKDIAIKDNVLFAANLRQKKNFITEKEWNVKVLRYKLDEVGTGVVSGSLTTTDNNIKDYYLPYYNPNTEVYNELNVVEAGSATSYYKTPLSGGQHELAHRYLPTMGSCTWGNNVFDTANTPTASNRRILGGASFGYYGSVDGASGVNALGGVQFSFRQIPKVSDTIGNNGGINDSASTFISANVSNDTLQTDNLYGAAGDTNYIDTEYKASMSFGSNKDAHASGNKRGYQRGETYRFGVLVYDLNGDPGNVLWIGDIQIPNHYDKAWELDLENTELGRDASNSKTKWKENDLAQDYRMSSHTDVPVPGHQLQYDDTSCILGTDTSSANETGQEIPFTPDAESNRHYTLDLAIDFTFKVPYHVRKKISGFRVVRAERTESDRTIIQSGVVNQILKYGGSTLEQGYCTDTQDGGIEAVPVTAGDTSNIAGDNVDEIYDTYLNGYCGVNAGSRRVIGQYNNGDPIYMNESEAASSTTTKYGSQSAEFGSYNYAYFNNPNQASGDRYYVHFERKAALLYSPDSTFGLRPYSFQNEDKIHHVSLLRLYSEERRNNTTLQKDVAGDGLSGRRNVGFDTYSVAYSASEQDTFSSQYGSDLSSLTIGNTDENTGLIFSTKKTTLDDESGVMIGKLAVYDTYFNKYKDWYGYYKTELPSNKAAYVINSVDVYKNAFNYNETDMSTYPTSGATYSTSDNPKYQYSDNQFIPTGRKHLDDSIYSLDLYNAKEIGDGELVSKDFFYKSSTNYWHIENMGFSNFSLGAAYLHSPNNYGNWWRYGKLNDTIDLTYETVSTVQMGTRAIILNTKSDFTSVLDPALHIQTQQYVFSKGTKPFIDINGTKTIHGFTPQPYYNYVNIWRNNDGQYGGDSLESIENTRWIIAGNFHPITKSERNATSLTRAHHTVVLGGDTFVGLYSHQITTSPYSEKSYSKFLVFPCESAVNTEMRSGYHLGAGDHIEGFDQTLPPFSNDWFYNEVYSQQNNLKSYLSLKDTDQKYTDLPVEIAYSKTKLAGEQVDAFRTFPIFNFYDVEAIYGQINRIINFNNEIHYIQENAFGQLLVNPRTFLQDTSGVQSIFTGSGDTIESHQYISVKYGSKHMHSVVSSERNLYFYDATYDKLLKYTSEKKLISISDDLGSRNIFEKATAYGRLKIEDKYPGAERVNLNDMPLYFIGIHGAFDYSTNSLYMTFNDRLRVDSNDTSENPTGNFITSNGFIDPYTESETTQDPSRFINSTTISYNEDIDAIISKYSVYPQQWIQHQNYLLTPKSRLPWLEYATSSASDGFANDNTQYGEKIHGVYGDNMDINHSGYMLGAHELSDGALQLWRWNDKSSNRTEFFDDIMQHEVNTFTSTQHNISYPATDGTVTTGQPTPVHKSYIEKIINEAPSENKKFDTLNIITSVGSFDDDYKNSENLLSKSRGVESEDAGVYFESLEFITDFTKGSKIDISTTNKPIYPSATQFSDVLHKYREGILRMPLRNKNITTRAVGTYLKARFSARTTEKFNIFAIIAKYRKSYN